MTLLPTLLAPLLILLVAAGGILIFYFTDPREKGEAIDPSRNADSGTFNRPPTRAKRKML